MILVAQTVACSSVLQDDKVVGVTYHILTFEGTPGDLQDIWNYICNLNKGSSYRELQWRHPTTFWTQESFGFSDKGTAAMIKLAFA